MELVSILREIKRKVAPKLVLDRSPYDEKISLLNNANDELRSQLNAQTKELEQLRSECSLLNQRIATLVKERNELWWQSESHQYLEHKGYMVPADLIMKTGAGPASFKQIADFHLATLQKWIGFEPWHHVLEIGCGIGRDAMSLCEIITEGSYLGIDIIKPSIDWCTANISSRHDNFRFVHYDVQDELHNRAGTLNTTEIAIPIDDGSIDRVFLFSVFTHMFQSDIEHYLREIRRVLKPGGLVYATTFLYTNEVLESARKTALTPYDLRFEHEISPGCRINNPDHPLGAVAYTREVWDRMIEATQMLYAKPILNGAWSGFYSSTDDGQDVVILTRE